MISAVLRRAAGSWRSPCHPPHRIPHQVSTVAVTVRPASLSAIHRGLRRSGRHHVDREPRPETSSRAHSRLDSHRTSKSLQGSASDRQRHKLMKKLARKDLEEDQSAGRKSRRKRFNDPESNFGKSSRVFLLKNGPLKDKVAALRVTKPPEVRGRYPTGEAHTRGAFMSRSNVATPRRLAASTWPAAGGDEAARVTTGRVNQQPMAPSARGPHHGKGPQRATAPMMINYTTAASQFLYGKSVVKSALQQGRRKLYKLYLLGDQDRQLGKDGSEMTRLAILRRVPVQTVASQEQRLMDKMSKGRPHNGFVLETSPLPQLPVTSLGKLEETPQRLGFHVELGHQGKEEEAVNGSDRFVARAGGPTPKPFVLLLNEILDPGNLGALLRTARYLGVDAVGISNRGSSSLTPVVLKAAAGAAEEMAILEVDSPVTFLEQSRKAGWRVYAAVAPPDRKLVRRHAGKFISTDDLEADSPLDSHPCLLVLGNEGYGLPKSVRMAADYELSVPRISSGGGVDSLNVSVAAGLLCHAFVRGRKVGEEGSRGVATEMAQGRQDDDGQRLF